MTKDPIVIAAELVVFLQTIVSREQDPLQPTVITVGSFHAGTKHNIIPDEAHLQLTVRTMSPEQREKTLAAIARATNGIAAAAGVPADRAPIITVSKTAVAATLNDPAKIKDAEEKGTRLPSLHSSEFAPMPEPAIRAGVKGMTTVVMDLLPKTTAASGSL